MNVSAHSNMTDAPTPCSVSGISISVRVRAPRDSLRSHEPAAIQDGLRRLVHTRRLSYVITPVDSRGGNDRAAIGMTHENDWCVLAPQHTA